MTSFFRNIVLASCCCLSTAVAAHAESWLDVSKDGHLVMTEFQSVLKTAGEPAIVDDKLVFGSAVVNDSFKEVDKIKATYGFNATVFQKIGEDFIRVSTNVMTDSGTRAVGTPLDKTGPAFAALKLGIMYSGKAAILGKEYATLYVPIQNAASVTIGAYFLGMPIAESK